MQYNKLMQQFTQTHINKKIHTISPGVDFFIYLLSSAMSFVMYSVNDMPLFAAYSFHISLVPFGRLMQILSLFSLMYFICDLYFDSVTVFMFIPPLLKSRILPHLEKSGILFL